MAAVHIVVLFTDLVGSTELSTRLPPGDADALRQAHFAVLRRAVAEHNGVEVKNLGDGVMVVFPSASAALAGAVAMQQGVQAHNRSGRQPLEVRIGLSAGEATVEDGDYFGEPVIEAARLCAAAEAGQILASELVRVSAGRRATQRFVPLGALPLKGLPDPVSTVEVTWEPLATEAAIPLPVRLAIPPAVGFFGRASELAVLAEALKAAAAGEGRRVVLLGGEPGMGKTTLCAEFARAAHAQGAIVLYGRCEEEVGLPYQPFVEALGHLVGHAPLELLTAHVAEHGGELAALVPRLGRRLGALPPAGTADPATQRFRLLAAVTGLLAAASADAPVVLILDDLHWADQPTLTMLRHVVGTSLAARLVLLVTYRQYEVTRDHGLSRVLASLHRESAISRVQLIGLDDADVMALMESGAGHELTGSFVDLAHAVRQETDGNPFFVGEVLRHLAERGWLYQDASGQWRAGGDLADLALPESVRDVVGHRVARLGSDCDRLLSTAAVIGRDFDLDVLGPVAGLGEQEMVEVLDRAVDAGLLTDLGPGRYSFAHAVIQHAVYEALTATRRSLLHRRVAESLESMYGAGPGPRVGEVARHWLAAGRPADAARALDYARWAGEAALAGLAPEEAIRWFTVALQIWADHRLPDERLRAELLIGLGTAQRLAGDPAYRETFLDAARLAEEIRDDDRLVRAALANNRGTYSASGVVDAERVAALEAALARGSGDSSARAQLLATLAVELTWAGDWPLRRQLADQALAMARRLGDAATLAKVAGLVHFCIWVPETLDERLAMTADVLALLQDETDPLVLHFAHRWRLYACANAGDLQGVDAHIPEVIRYSEACRDPHTGWVTKFVRSWRSLLAGDLEDAEEQAVSAFASGTQSGQPEAATVLAMQLFDIRRQQDRLDEVERDLAGSADRSPGISTLRALLAALYCEVGKPQEADRLLKVDGADGFARLPYDFLWLSALCTYADACAALHEVEPARALYGRLSPWHSQVTAVSAGFGGGAVAFYLGLLATVLERFDTAESHFAEAMEIHQRMRSPYWIGRTQLESARMLLARGQPADASPAAALLDEVEATATRYGLAHLSRHAGLLRR